MKRQAQSETDSYHNLLTLKNALLQNQPGALAKLEHYGKRCREEGRHRDLADFLENLPGDLRRSEQVLYWRFSCALREGRAETLRAEVEAHLAAHEAPELRALYAGTLAPWERALDESRRAYHVQQTSLTLYQYGRLHPDSEAGLTLLREAVRLAEQQGDTYSVTRSAGALLSRLIYAGHYREAAHWGSWALLAWDTSKLRDPLRRMLLVNDFAYARLLCGDVRGLCDCLGAAPLDGLPEYDRLYRGTLADYLLVRGEAAQALVHYRANFEAAPRRLLGSAALDLVRGLLEVGEAHAAREVAERAYHLTRGEAAAFHASAKLALGVALCTAQPDRAEVLLEESLETFLNPLEAHRLAQSALHLAWLRLRRGDRAGARAALTRAAPGLAELDYTGFRLLVAQPGVERLWELAQSRDRALEVYALGRAEVWLEGTRLELRLRELEIVLLLALQPQGLSLEKLHQRLGEPGRSAVKTAISRLRRKLPITSAPYRLETSVYTDVAAFRTALKKGDLDEALRLYGGELLGASSTLGVAELRDTLEATLHAAVLKSRDVDALIAAAERSHGDLHLWESALELLSPQDARAPIVRARVKQLRASWDR